MIRGRILRAIIFKDLTQFKWTVVIGLVFGLFFMMLFLAEIDPGYYRNHYEDDGYYYDYNEYNDRETPRVSLFNEAYIYTVYCFVTAFFAFPILYPLILHKEIESKTIKALATYPISFHEYKFYKLGSFMVNGALVLLVLAFIPVAMVLAVAGTGWMFLELVLLYLFMILGMGFLALLSLTVNDLVVTILKRRAYFSHLLFSMLVFVSAVFTETSLEFIHDLADDDYSPYNDDPPWDIQVLPLFSVFHVIGRSLDKLTHGHDLAFDGYVVILMTVVLIGLTYYLRPRHNFDDWF